MAGDPARSVAKGQRMRPRARDRPWWRGREGTSVAKVAAACALVGAAVGLVTSFGAGEGLVVAAGSVIGLSLGALVALAVNAWRATR